MSKPTYSNYFHSNKTCGARRKIFRPILFIFRNAFSLKTFVAVTWIEIFVSISFCRRSSRFRTGNLFLSGCTCALQPSHALPLLRLGNGRAHAYGAKLLRSWVWFPPGASLFSSLSIPQFWVLNQVPLRWASLLISSCSLGRNKRNKHIYCKTLPYVS